MGYENILKFYGFARSFENKKGSDRMSVTIRKVGQALTKLRVIRLQKSQTLVTCPLSKHRHMS
jgi:hypothetical protein